MAYKGIVRGSVIELEGDVELPEGTPGSTPGSRNGEPGRATSTSELRLPKNAPRRRWRIGFVPHQFPC